MLEQVIIQKLFLEIGIMSCIWRDTGQGTSSNRIKWYVNGTLQTSYNTTTTTYQNVDFDLIQMVFFFRIW